MLMFYYYSFLVTSLSFIIFYLLLKNTKKSLMLSLITGIFYFIYLLYKFRNVLWMKKNKNKIIVNEIIELKNIQLYPGTTYPYKMFRMCSYPTNDNNIPKIIFRMSGFPFTNLPEQIQNVLDSCTRMNPNYIQIYLDNNDCDLFIEEFYPMYSESYHSIIPGAFKSDIVRLLLLHKYGGVYSDIGHTFLKPLDIFIDNSDKIVIVKDKDITDLDNSFTKIKNLFTVSRPYAIHNAFIAITQNHDVMLYIVDYIHKNISEKKYGENSLDITGPLAVGKSFNLFFGRKEETPLVVGKHDNGLKILYLNSDDSEKLQIVNENNESFINTKFPGYYKLMYSKNPKYGELWKMNLVYI